MIKRTTVMLIYIITFFSSVNFAQVPVITQQPLNQGVIEGDSANFAILASGDSLTYQWYKDGSIIGGANDSVYTTPPTILGDNGSEFFVIVTNSSGSDTSNSAKLFVTAIGSRVTASLVAAYDFKEGSGTTINDISSVGAPLNLTIPDLKSALWTAEGLNISNPTKINSVVAASKVIDSCNATNELTVETWIVPDSLTQGTPSAPSGIVTLTTSNDFRNFSLEQITTRFEGSVRTTQTTDYGSPTQTANGVVETKLTHLVFTRNSNGNTKIYFNGAEIASDSIAGEFFNSWSPTHKLAIANTVFGQRPWLGTFYYTGIYNRSLTSNEINHNFSLGIPSDTLPFIVIQPTDKGAIAGQTVEFFVKAISTLPLSYQWQKNGVDIPGANNVYYETDILTITDNNSTFRVIVSNSNGNDTSDTVVLAVTPANVRVTNGLVLLYKFQEGSGTLINDLSGFGTPLNLQIYTPASAQWTDYGLNVTSSASIISNSAPTKLYNALTSANEITMEAWIKPSLKTQSGRIITLSQDTGNRNFTLQQENNDSYEGRLRTTVTSNNGFPSLFTPTGITQTSFTHVVYTRKTNGVAKIYVNGSEVNSLSLDGNFSNWNPAYLLAIANEFGGARPWLGIFNLIAIYDRALDSIEVEHNFNQLPEGGYPNIKTPGELTAEPKLNKVELAWVDSSDNEDGFIIERKYSSFDFTVIDSVIANATSFVDSNVVDTTNYTYRVKAYNIATESGYSNETSVTTILSTITAPSNLTANLSPTIVNRAMLVWEDNSTNELGFIIERKTGDSASAAPFSVVDSVAANLTSFEDSTLADTTIYTFRVKAYNLFIESSYTNVASVTTILSTVEAPTGLTANLSPTIVNRVQLTWQDNSPNELGFIVERKTGDSASVEPFSVLDTLAADVTSFEDSTLSDTTTYTFRVKAFNTFIESGYSNLASVTTVLSTLNAPTDLTASLSSTIVNLAQLTWQDNSSNELGFIVERKTGDSASVEPFSVLDTLAADITSFEDSTLADTTTYTFRVKAFNAFTESGYSNLAWVTTILSTVAAPGSLTAIVNPADTNNVLLNWADNSPNELGFIIERKTGDSSSVDLYVVIDSVAADVISYEDTTVADTTTYTYRVQGFNEFTVSEYSNQAEVTTPVPVELTLFTASVTDKYVQLDWETATELNNAGFSIQRSKDNNKFIDLAFVKGKGTTTTQSLYSYTDKSVLSGKYYYRLKQVDFDGSVTFSKSTEVDLGVPKDYALEQNYPNPFNPSTTIRFALPINARVIIKLYNALGQEVITILNTDLDAGIHEAVFNASNLSSGVYFYMLKVQGANNSNFTSTKRMILMK